MSQKLLTVKEVSEILDLKPARVYELTRQHKIPFVQIGERQYRYHEPAIWDWIEHGGNKEKGKKTVEKWFAIELFSSNAEFPELSEFNQCEQETNSDNSGNSDIEETFIPSDNKLFDLSIEEPKADEQSTDLPIE